MVLFHLLTQMDRYLIEWWDAQVLAIVVVVVAFVVVFIVVVLVVVVAAALTEQYSNSICSSNQLFCCPLNHND